LNVFADKIKIEQNSCTMYFVWLATKLQPASYAITLQLIVTVSSETGVRHAHTSFK